MTPTPVFTGNTPPYLKKEALRAAAQVHNATMVALAHVLASRPLQYTTRQDLMESTREVRKLERPVASERDRIAVAVAFFGTTLVGVPLVYGNDEAAYELEGAARLLRLARSWARTLTHDIVSYAALRLSTDNDVCEYKPNALYGQLRITVNYSLVEAASAGDITLSESALWDDSGGFPLQSPESAVMTACIIGVFHAYAGRDEDRLFAALETTMLALLESWGYQRVRPNPLALLARPDRSQS